MTDCSFGNWFVSGDELRCGVRASLTRDLFLPSNRGTNYTSCVPVLKPTTDQWDQFFQSSRLTGLDIDFDERSSYTASGLAFTSVVIGPLTTRYAYSEATVHLLGLRTSDMVLVLKVIFGSKE